MQKCLLNFRVRWLEVEIMHSKSVEVWCKGSAPSILGDTCGGIRITLSKTLGTEIISTKVTELNINYLNEAGEYEKDYPVTEQFVTKFDVEKNKFVTKPCEIFINNESIKLKSIRK